MIRGLWTQGFVVLALGAAGNWSAAQSAEFRCRNGDQERRIELGGPDASQGIVCEVRYWRDAKAAGDGRVLWRAQQDAEFCAARARELIARLESGGWTCGAGEQPGSAAPTQAARAVPPPAADAPAETAPALTPDKPDTVRPAAPSPSAAVQTEPSRPETAVETPSASPKAAILDQVVTETLHSANQLYGGEFEAEHTAFGDLDGDGSGDAVVLITYQEDRDNYVQYLVAYLFTGETFQSVATRNVGGRFLNVLRADLQGIADRRILVELEALDGEDTCCTTRRTAFTLQNGQLVETTDPGAPDPERTGQAEKSSG